MKTYQDRAEAASIRFLAYDSQLVVLRGLQQFVEEHADLVMAGLSTSTEDAVAIYRRLNPDVVVLGLSSADDFMAVQPLVVRIDTSKALIFSSSAQDEVIIQALEQGIRGFLPKTASSQQFADALRSIAHGQAVLSADAINALTSITLQRGQAAPPELTRRESEALQLMIQGLTNIEIAHSLGISRSTARWHVNSVIKKFEVTNRTQAVAKAIEAGLVD